MPRSAYSATQSTWIMSTSASFWAWKSVIALSWKPWNGESTSVSRASGCAFSKPALTSAMCFSPTSPVFHWSQRTSAGPWADPRRDPASAAAPAAAAEVRRNERRDVIGTS